jgi:diguanylate cyclase (GGDEF)-like protein/PAS domain S-box-containing protein
MSNGCNDELKQLYEKYSKLKDEYEILLKAGKNHADKFKSIFDQLPHLAVQGYNSKREIIYWNDFSTRLYGYERHEAIGNQLEDLIIPAVIREKVIADIENWVSHDIPVPSCELSLKHKNGSLVPVFTQHIMLELPGNEKEMYCLDIDLSELKEKENLLQEAKRLAITDGLTNLYNRLFYMQMADLEIKLAKRDRKYLVFAMFDMDNFKKFNDTYGHRQGDKLLKAFADILNNHCCRPNDYPFRIGGEEFLLIYSAGSVERSPDLAKRIFDAFLQLDVPHRSNSHHKKATLSAGISVLSPESELEADKLYHYADKALYEAKENGRNKYVISYH